MNQLKITLAEIKNVSVSEVSSIDKKVGTFILRGKSVYMFDLTKTGKVKKGSVKFLHTVENYNNCSH